MPNTTRTRTTNIIGVTTKQLYQLITYYI